MAALGLAVEGVLLALLGIGYAVRGLVGEPENRLGTVLAGAIALLVGLALVPVSRALAVPKGWALAPTVVVQLFVGVVAWGLLQAHVYEVALPMFAGAALVLYELGRPETRDVLREAG